MNFPDKVFFVASHGMAGDPWFDWLQKSLDSHNDIFIFSGESVRAKYFKERKRNERPDIEKYAQFLYDFGAHAYNAVGECFGYRAYQLENLEAKNINIPWVNVIRHPYAWLSYYVKWRVNNMNQDEKTSFAVDHEWSISWHDYFKNLCLMPYKRNETHIWASYQGMTVLDRMISDSRVKERNYQLERLVSDRNYFNGMIYKISKGRVNYNSTLLDLIYSQTNINWRDNDEIIEGTSKIKNTWEDWKKEAFKKIVSKKSQQFFIDAGYKL